MKIELTIKRPTTPSTAMMTMSQQPSLCKGPFSTKSWQAARYLCNGTKLFKHREVVTNSRKDLKKSPAPPEVPVVAWARTCCSREEGGRSDRWAVELVPFKVPFQLDYLRTCSLVTPGEGLLVERHRHGSWS